MFSTGVMVLPLAEIWGKVEYDEKIFSCEVINRDSGIEPLPVMVGMGVLSTWITSLAVYIYIRIKVKNEAEETEIYLRKLKENNFDIANDANAKFNQKLIEKEKNATRTVTFLIISFTCTTFPCNSIIKMYLHFLN